MTRPTVYLASPFAGEYEVNQAYLTRALAHSLSIGEAPFAPHGLYPRVLDDTDPAQRAAGMDAGIAWLRIADRLVCYGDRGISPGMRAEIREWQCSRSADHDWRDSYVTVRLLTAYGSDFGERLAHIRASFVGDLRVTPTPWGVECEVWA